MPVDRHDCLPQASGQVPGVVVVAGPDVPGLARPVHGRGQDLGDDHAEPGAAAADLVGEFAGPLRAPRCGSLTPPEDHAAIEAADPDRLGDVRAALAPGGDRDQVSGEAPLEFLCEQVLPGEDPGPVRPLARRCRAMSAWPAR